MSLFPRKDLCNSNLIVIKIGTSSITDTSGCLEGEKFRKLAQEVHYIVSGRKKQVVLVSSGAIAAGVQKLGRSKAVCSIPEKQAAAAIGQNLLLTQYEKAFGAFGLAVGQVLLTRDAMEDRERYLNSRNTILQLLKFGAVPVINENDTMATDEIRVGDNDNLSALVASLIGADLLILLSDVEGFFMDGKLLSYVDKITKEIGSAAKGSSTLLGTGGMSTKLDAAKIVLNAGIPMVIADNKKEGVITSVLDGNEEGTLFVPKLSRMESKKRWIAHGKKPAGQVVIDAGACKALLEGGKSLLAVGIKEIKGRFGTGEVIGILDGSKKEIGRGLTNYTSEQLARIKGLKTSEIEKEEEGSLGEEVVHRDNMVIL
ncbi:MAG: glutamate 5-kinase [Candidatus Margulisiibacteriota bacterium]